MIRWAGIAAVAGGALWIVSWLGNSQTDEGNRDYLGLVEGDWRALLNPVLVTFLVAVWAADRRFGHDLGRAGEAAAAAAAVGLALALAGNVIEFGLLGGDVWHDVGWALVILGAPIALVGLVVLGVLGARRLEDAPQWLFAFAAAFFSAIPLWPITVGLGFALLGAGVAWPERETLGLTEEPA